MRTHGITFPAPPAAVAAYIATMAEEGFALATIKRRCAAIAKQHRVSKQLNPTDHHDVREVLKGLTRANGVAQKQKVAATGTILSKALVDPSTSLRDKAILVVGFVTAMRRAEIVALTWDAVEDFDDGIVIHIRRSKTDQEGVGRKVGVPMGRNAKTCPVRILRAWKRECQSERVFPCDDEEVSFAMKRAAKLAGYNPAEFGAHSLRAGLLTTAQGAGVGLAETMQQSGHRSATIAARYIRPESVLTNRAAHAAVDALSPPPPKRKK